jgi:hypothetical protein
MFLFNRLNREPQNGQGQWTEKWLPYNGMNRAKFGQHGPYTANNPLRQHIDLYCCPSNQPTPVYFYAHSNGANVGGLSGKRLKIIGSTGFSVISWESVSNPKSQTDYDTCLKDFELLWSWFKKNAAKYNLDPNYVVIGGRSRGTAISWLMAHSQKPEIKGIYMHDALPDNAWNKASVRRGSSTIWEEVITANSPQAYLLYGQECTKPICQNCVPSPNPKDIHNPKHGQTIVNRYTKLGIQSKIKMIDGLVNKGMNMIDFFPEFVASLPKKE